MERQGEALFINVGSHTAESAWAALSEANRIALASHNPQGSVSTAASLQLGFAEPSYVICESVHQDVPWRADVVSEGFQVDLKTRTVRPGTAAGWVSR